MNHRPLRRAIVLSLGALLACVGAASADTFKADGDALTPGIQTVMNLGSVAPGATLVVNVPFVVTCSSTSHLDPGQTVTAGVDSAVAPLGGAIDSVTDGTVGPMPAGWPTELAPCALPAQTFSTGTPSVVTLRAPTVPGVGYTYSIMYHRSIDPFGSNDDTAIRQATAIDIVLNVVVNTPPTLTSPTIAATGTAEANTTGGWTADWSGLGATDTEDDPDPIAGCNPVAGTVLPLGTTSVTCSVTDSGGLGDSDTFGVTVVDTTAPTLSGVPADQDLTTSDPTGTTLTYALPSATDIADATPTVGCLPVSGSHIGTGTTTVTCTASDDSGNTASASFVVTVTYVAPHTASAAWGEPVAGPGSTFTANRGRNVPVKVQLYVDGVARTAGDARLTLTPCGGGEATTFPLSYSGGRWNASLDTNALSGTCYTVVASIDGLAAGSFRLELRGADAVKAPNKTPTTTTAKSSPKDTPKAVVTPKAAPTNDKTRPTGGKH